MRRKYAVLFLLSGAVLGVLSGMMWFGIGSWFDRQSDFFVLTTGLGERISLYFGAFTSFFIVPAILPLLIAGAVTLVKFSRKNLIISAGFVAVYYGSHWLPVGLLLLYCIIFNKSF